MSTLTPIATEPTPPIRPAAAPPTRPRWWHVLAIVAAAFNARTAVTAVGAALPEIRAALGLGTGAVVVLTALPCLCIAATTSLVPLLQRRMGARTGVVLFLGFLVTGQAIRVAEGQWLLLAGTALACCSIGGMQVLLPAVCQQIGGPRAAALTMLSASTIGAGAATATATTPWLTEVGGWRAGLGAWIIPVVVALLLWAPLAQSSTPQITAPQLIKPRRSLLRSSRAWYLTMFMGLQSLQSLSLLSWQPVLLRTTGADPSRAAALSTDTLVVSIAASAIITASCYRKTTRIGHWMVLTTCSGGIGLLGLLIAPSATPILWAALLGVGMAALAPAMAAIPAYAVGDETTRLSAMVQGFGYLLAAIGPALIGALTDATSNAEWTLTALLFCSLVQLLFATLTTRPPET
ncbi:MFS transporter [Saccharopolyspora sp. NPDC002376]